MQFYNKIRELCGQPSKMRAGASMCVILDRMVKVCFSGSDVEKGMISIWGKNLLGEIVRTKILSEMKQL
jgi:hypothetical protein